MGKIYLDRHEFHAELTICKKRDSLTTKSITMFQKFCTEVSRDYYFDDKEDQKDAISQALHDCIKYWRNFKESNVVQLQFGRNFEPGDKIRVYINNLNEILEFNASTESNLIFREFQIDKSVNKKETYLINKSLSNLQKVIETRDSGTLSIFIDKVKNKITLMDKYNGDTQSLKSYVDVVFTGTQPIIPDKKQLKVQEKMKTTNRYYFEAPPNGFSYFTSIIRNACLKSINKINPKALRNGNKLSFQAVNAGENGFYSI